MGREHLFGEFKYGDCLFAAYTRKMVKEHRERLSGF